jgi:hypothetical protein
MLASSSGHDDRLVIYPSRIKVVLVLLGAIAFVAAGLWIGSPDIAGTLPLWKVVIATYVGVPFFGACGLYAAYRLARHRPAVEIDSTGFTDSSSAIAAGRLSWGEVDRVVVYSFYGQMLLGIVPRDLEMFMSRQSIWRRWVTRLNLALGCSPANIAQVILPMPVRELAELLRARYGVRVESD